MPISKDQPMRPYLDALGDAVDGMDDIEAAIDLLDARVTALEQGGGGRGFTIANADVSVPTVDMTSDASGEVSE